jgi:hypothetical protein
MSFEHDIMISYAWRDNQPPPLSESDGWVSNLQLVLEYWLRQLMSKQPKVWRDKNQMPGNKVFAEELDETVAKVAVLITVVSEPYLSSEWCARELENFIKHAHAQGGLQVENDYRIFKINKLPVDRKVIPEPLKAVTGFDFYEADPETRIMTPIDPSLGKEEKEEFSKKVYNVANAMSRLLKAIEAKGIKQKFAGKENAAGKPEGATAVGVEPTEGAAEAGSAKTGLTVYLPYSSRDLREVRDDLVSELQRRGCNVIPNEPPTWADIDEFNKSMADDLAMADIAVHLLGSRYGSILEGETRSVTELQIDLAAAESKKRGLRRLIWMPKDMAELNAQQAAFIQRLRGDRNSLEGADLLEDTLENLKSSVIDMLKPKPAPQAVAAADGETEGSLQLYIMHDASDKDAVRELRKALKGKQAGDKAISVILPVFEGEAAELRELQRQKLRECDAVMVFWGGASQAWVDASLNEIRKAPGFGRSKKFGGRHLVILSGTKSSPKNDWVLDFKDGLLEEDLHTVEAWAEIPLDQLDQHLKTLR